ncbi:hypothetical protein E4J49_24175 [Vibrio parahaemolyticus]|nr:hypothetical protein [Vibrio parahaemolyticus]EGQ9547069.1 hypothetical protein [Vibrio parahaemolyticus]EGQ9561294.1 hypothetical protein [Vibrio parahaemolyticus]EGQ9609173.1 hypothetical protein [Vibrio parahaemolyticus]EGQ9652461.1 hypothetical protein [Vibrio parahaemolyticus]
MLKDRHKPNKQFKSDSARLAFLVWVKFSVYGGQIKSRGRVLHTLIGRYNHGIKWSIYDSKGMESYLP